MRVYGLDFTSAPTKRKPIICAACQFENGTLILEQTEAFTSFTEFERFLERDGPWLAAIDAPFGQPRELIENLGWPQTWEAYVRYVAGLGKEGFIDVVRVYKEKRPKGEKEHRRKVDVLSKAISPMKFSFIPVGRMFYQLAPRLEKTPLNIPLLRPMNDSRVVVEAYPALMARPIGPYKHDHPNKQTMKHLEVRRVIVRKLLDDAGTKVGLSPEQQERLVNDPKADVLDAFLCAVQGTWAYSQRSHNYGIPHHADKLEGWIADPSLL